MPVNKSAFLRYRIIDKCLTNPMKKFPSMEHIIDRIEEQLGTCISFSMFNKDIAQMRLIYNAPVQYNRLHKGYHYTQEGFSISQFPLTNDEIEALDFSTALLQQLKGTRMFHHFENAINKVIEGYRLCNIIGKSESQLLQVEEPVRCDSGHWLEKILKAIVNKQCLKVIYRGFGKPEKVHHVSPYLLKEYRNRWYMIGFSDISKSVLVMALDRIHDIAVNKGKYICDKDFSPADFFRFSLGITQLHGSKPEEIVLAFSKNQAPYIISQPLHHSQVLVAEKENEIHFRLFVYPTTELKMTILSYGSQVRVLKPLMLKDQIKDEIISMKNNYSSAKRKSLSRAALQE